MAAEIEEELDEVATLPAHLKPADDFRQEEDTEERLGEESAGGEVSTNQSPDWWLVGSGFMFILSGIAPVIKEIVEK